jgi:hypothetical protein
MWEMTNSYRFVIGTPERKIQFRRPMTFWLNIKTDLKEMGQNDMVNCTHLT